jgi:hypothetical protein
MRANFNHAVPIAASPDRTQKVAPNSLFRDTLRVKYLESILCADQKKLLPDS